MDVQPQKQKRYRVMHTHNLQIPLTAFPFNSTFFSGLYAGFCFEIFKGIGLKLAFL